MSAARSRPVARTGPRPDGALPLAGQDHVWFDEIDGPDTPERRAALSARRAPVAGLALDRPRIMGILNVTPDSFSDGGDHHRLEAAVTRARAMAGEVDIIDIGGESTRPGAQEVPEAEEIARTAPVIRAIRDAGIATPISIDTRKASVGEAALDAGADMLNDVTAMRFDPKMAGLAAERDVPICLMHSIADPETMQNDPRYRDVVGEVYDHLAERFDAALSAGCRLENLISDPGIGFGKTVQHNLSLIRALSVFHGLGGAILLGVSRKRFIGTIGGAEAAKDRLGGSIAMALEGVRQGAQILRVHDTYDTAQAVKLQLALDGQTERGT